MLRNLPLLIGRLASDGHLGLIYPQNYTKRDKVAGSLHGLLV
jgi:hypothetical protein